MADMDIDMDLDLAMPEDYAVQEIPIADADLSVSPQADVPFVFDMRLIESSNLTPQNLFSRLPTILRFRMHSSQHQRRSIFVDSTT
jgi:hypothetical protein